ncbi:MAG: outer membrane protein transport protein [Myxococcota bacterium]
MFTLWAGAAFAGGYYYSDAGIVATGRGGAFVAGADNQFAQYYNPAGLIRIPAPTVNVGWSGVQQNVSFTRLRSDGSRYPTVENQASPFDVPELGFATPVGDRAVLALGFYSPFAPSSLYDEEGPQRYSIKDTEIYQFSIGPSAAVRVHEMLVLGVGLQWQYLRLGEEVDLTVSGNETAAFEDDPTGDIAVSAKVNDPFTFGVNAGLLFEPVDALTIGLALQPGTKFRAGGEGALDFDGNTFATLGLLDQTRYVDDDIRLDIALPWVIRAGIAVRPVPRLEIEGAVVWQDWSSLGDIVIDDVDVTLVSDSPLIPDDQKEVAGRFELPAGLRDTFSLRLGVEGQVTDRIELRAGGFWENGSVDTPDLSVALVDPAKFQIGAGGSVWAIPSRLKFDVAYARLFFPSLEIRDSTVEQIDAGVLPTATPNIVGNGDLSSNGWVLGLAGSVSFPKRASR